MSSEELNALRFRNDANHLVQVDKCSVKRSKPSESDSSFYPSCSSQNNLQLNNLFLNLKSSTRDSLISILVQFCSVLVGKAPTSESKEKLLADNSKLIESLGDLQLRLEDEENEEQPRKKVKREDAAAAVNRELVFTIDWNTKSKIISLLLANKNFAFLSKTNSMLIKNKLVNQNNAMIGILINLEPDALEVPAVTRKAGRAEEDAESETATSNVTNQVVKKLNDRISDLEMRLKNDLKCLREELVKAVQDVNNGRQEIKFDWELKPFSELSTSKVYRSSWFYVRNVPWYLFARVSEIRDGSRFLDVFLCLQNNYGCNKWSCSAKFDIRILNQSGKENIVVKNEHIFMQNEGFGSEKIVLLNKLVENGFVKDDTLRLQVKLKAGEIVKN